jgi:hypothetical protein
MERLWDNGKICMLLITKWDGMGSVKPNCPWRLFVTLRSKTSRVEEFFMNFPVNKHCRAFQISNWLVWTVVLYLKNSIWVCQRFSLNALMSDRMRLIWEVCSTYNCNILTRGRIWNFSIHVECTECTKCLYWNYLHTCFIISATCNLIESME